MAHGPPLSRLRLHHCHGRSPTRKDRTTSGIQFLRMQRLFQLWRRALFTCAISLEKRKNWAKEGFSRDGLPPQSYSLTPSFIRHGAGKDLLWSVLCYSPSLPPATGPSPFWISSARLRPKEKQQNDPAARQTMRQARQNVGWGRDCFLRGWSRVDVAFDRR
jgi:hypothetical protein